ADTRGIERQTTGRDIEPMAQVRGEERGRRVDIGDRGQVLPTGGRVPGVRGGRIGGSGGGVLQAVGVERPIRQGATATIAPDIPIVAAPGDVGDADAAAEV